MDESFVTSLRLLDPQPGEDRAGYPWELATIYTCHEDGLERTEYDDAEPVRLTRSFLDAREQFLDQLLTD